MIRLQTVTQNDGAPPAEISALVQRTIGAARAALRAAKGHGSYDALSIALGMLVEDLDGWRPYGG